MSCSKKRNLSELDTANNTSHIKKKSWLPFALIPISMFAVAYISVPLYSLFCKVTGFGGTTQEAISCPIEQGDRMITVRFNADAVQSLGWKFTPNQKYIKVRTGQCSLAWYTAKNIMTYSDTPSKGMALYNVTPIKAGKYFHKVECFCFREQVLYPGQQISMPVLFYIDPSIEKNSQMNDVHDMTLSYSFFQYKESFAKKFKNSFYTTHS